MKDTPPWYQTPGPKPEPPECCPRAKYPAKNKANKNKYTSGTITTQCALGRKKR